MRVLSVVGNRPQFIKSAPLSIALREAGIDEVVLHTGQHYDDELSRVFFDELGLPEPRHRLDLRTADVETMRAGIAPVVAHERPDWVLVYGDTNSTRAGAEAADGVPIAHVEAGLRSFDLSMPEEHNRMEVDRLASLLLCPDERSSEQLASEGITGLRVVVGDAMADAARIFGPVARARSSLLETLGVEPRQYLLCTIHREANVHPDRLRWIAAALDELEPERVVFPAHPRTRAALDGLGPRRFDVMEPVGYLDFASLASQARVIVTDSGGLQKEAYWYGVPCVTVRPSTEWVDTVEAGANRVVEPGDIVRAVREASFPEDAPQLYGDGHASERIAESLLGSLPRA